MTGKTMDELKAIETRYQGYRFRSRLEARWGVFFDALGLKWEYEPQGFDLPCGNYLPDFWLTQVKMWAEVKPVEFSAIELEKAQQLARLSGSHVLQLIGIPENKPYWAIGWATEVGFYEDAYCLTMEKIAKGRFYYGPSDFTSGGDAYWPDTEAAATAARSARFEFCENGSPYNMYRRYRHNPQSLADLRASFAEVVRQTREGAK